MRPYPPASTPAAENRLRVLVAEIAAHRRILGLPDVGERPLLLKLDTTNLCNLQCKECGVFLIRDVVNERSMSADLLRTVGDTVFPLCHEVCFGSLAEPWMSPVTEQALELARGRGVPFLQVVTNALLLNERRIRELLRLRVDLLSVSTDAATQETYGRIRGADLKTVVKNVGRVRDLKLALGTSKPKIRFNFVVLRSSLHELPRMVDFAHDLGAEIIEFSMPFIDRRMDLDDEIPTGDRALWDDAMAKTRARLDDLGVPVGILPSLPASPTATVEGADHPPPEEGTPWCLAPWTYLSISPNGDVYPCCSPYMLGGPPLGNLGERGIADILTSPRHENLRASLLSGRLGRDCARCKATDFTTACELDDSYYLNIGPRLPRTGA